LGHGHSIVTCELQLSTRPPWLRPSDEERDAARDPAPQPATGGRLARTLALVLAPTYLLVLATFLLPPIPLDGWLARASVVIADSGSVRVLPFLTVAALIVVVSRSGVELRRRFVEGLILLLSLLTFLGAMAWANEHTIKPAAAVARPNILALSEDGSLALEADDFYALGDKQDRREYLEAHIDEIDEPLAPTVRAHWIEETGYSFPSGHSLAAMTFASFFLAIGLIWMSGWRRALVFCFPVWALLVIYSRPLLRVHSPVDVSVGALEGLLVGLGAFLLARWLIEGREPPADTASS
jgi:phosphatidylglycerophosphatase B